MHLIDERLPFKLLSNEWDKMKNKGHLRKGWLAHVNSLKKGSNLQDEVLEMKVIKEAVDK